MSSDQPYFPSFQIFVNNTSFVQVQDKLVVPRAYSCYVSVVSASLPITFYNLRGFQLTFTYRVATESINRFFTFTVPQGHYSSTELADACLWAGTLAGTTNTTQFFTAYQGQQNKFQMMFSPNSQLTILALTPGTLASQMGFTASTTDMYGTYFPCCGARRAGLRRPGGPGVLGEPGADAPRLHVQTAVQQAGG